MGQKDKIPDRTVYRVDRLVGVMSPNIVVHVMVGTKLTLVDFELRKHTVDLLDDILDMGPGLGRRISF